MDEEETKIWLKVRELVKGGHFSESTAKKFLASLSPSDYDRIILVLEKNEIRGISQETMKKVLSVLRRLSDKGLR